MKWMNKIEQAEINLKKSIQNIFDVQNFGLVGGSHICVEKTQEEFNQSIPYFR